MRLIDDNSNNRKVSDTCCDLRVNEYAAQRRAGSSGAFLPPSPPAEKATAREDQSGQSSAGEGAGDTDW
jgi:hypothetical protein